VPWAYWRLKGLAVDLVIWNEDSAGYRQLLQEQIMGLIAAGIILNIAGNSTQNPGLVTASLPVIGLGLILHLVGFGYRGRQIRKGYKK